MGLDPISRSTGREKALAIAAALVLLAGAGAFLLAHRGGHGERRERAARVADRRQERARREARLEAFVARERVAAPTAGGSSGGAALAPAEQAALKDAVDGAYDPKALLAALEDPASGAVAEYLAKTDAAFAAFEAPASLDGPDGPVPISPRLRAALDQASMLRTYAANLLHARHPEALERQWRTVEKIDDSFRTKFDALDAAYPFLGARMVEAP